MPDATPDEADRFDSFDQQLSQTTDRLTASETTVDELTDRLAAAESQVALSAEKLSASDLRVMSLLLPLKRAEEQLTALSYRVGQLESRPPPPAALETPAVAARRPWFRRHNS